MLLNISFSIPVFRSKARSVPSDKITYALSPKVEIPDTTDNPYYGVIIKGTFVENDFIENSVKQAEKDMINIYHKDYKIYTDSDKKMGVSFLTDDELVIGNLDAVKDVIDVKLGYKSGIQGAPIKIYNSLGNAIIKMAATIPDTSSLHSGYSTPMFPGQAAYEDIESMGMTMGADGDVMNFNVHLFFGNADSAQKIKRQYEELMEFMTTMNDMYTEEGMAQIPDEIINFMDITQTDTRLEINMKLTDEEFEDFSKIIVQSMLGSMMQDTSREPDLGYYGTQDIQPFYGEF